MYGEMQESGLTDILFIYIPSCLGPACCDLIIHSLSSSITVGSGIQLVTQALFCLGSEIHIWRVESLMAATSLFSNMSENTPFLAGRALGGL